MTDIQALKSQLTSDDNASKCSAAEALLTTEGSQEAAVELVRAVGTDDENLMEAANGALEQIESISPEQATELAAILPGDDTKCHPNSAFWAATLLGRMQEAAAVHVDSLVAALETCEDSAALQKIVWAIGQIGPQASSAGNHLQQLTESDDARLARLATSALERIGV